MKQETTQANAEADVNAPEMNDPTPAPTDPGGAHAKGYSADPKPGNDVQEPDPVPLSPGPHKHPAVRVPERDNHVKPTGRAEPGDYTPSDQVPGLDNN